MITKAYLFILLAILVIQTKSETDTELKLVQILFRHGDRTPVMSYPNDPYKESYWEKYGGFGQLTQTGMNQHYQFGQFLRKTYNEFLNKYYSRKDLRVISTHYDRTLMSAYSLLNGLYSPKDFQLWNKEIKWQPIPVYPLDGPNDTVFYAEHEICPRADHLKKEIVKTEEYAKKNNKYKHLLDIFNKNSGCNNKPHSHCAHLTLMDEWRIGDCLYVEKTHGLKLPDWANEISDQLRYSLGWGFYFNFRTPEMARLRSGGILRDMRENIFSKIYQNDTKQLHLYSAHDMNVAALTKLLNFTSFINQPQYAAAIGLELHKEKKNSNYYVKVFYKNNTATEDINYRNVKMFGCDELCPIEEFTRLTQDLIISDFSSECKLKEGDDSASNVIYDSLKSTLNNKFIANVCFAILILSVITAVLIMVAIFKKPSAQRQYTNFDGNVE